MLLIHIDNTAVNANSQRAARPNSPPARCITQAAIHRSSFCCLRPAAKAKPPKNKKIIGSEKWDKALGRVKIPVTVAKKGTSKAVTLTCKASLSHNQAITATKANPAATSASRGNQKRITTKAIAANRQ